MLKDFSIAVPDELYIDDFTGNKTLSLTYDGPDTLTVKVDTEGNFLGLAITGEVLPDNCFYVEVNADKDTSVAYFALHQGELCQYIFGQETMENGEIHQYITNPRLEDYYRLLYKKDENNVFVWKFSVITRRRESTEELQVIRESSRIIDLLGNTALDSVSQPIYDAYIAQVNDFLTLGKNYKAWKYIVHPLKDKAPKVPLQLIRLVNELEQFRKI